MAVDVEYSNRIRKERTIHVYGSGKDQKIVLGDMDVTRFVKTLDIHIDPDGGFQHLGTVTLECVGFIAFEPEERED